MQMPRVIRLDESDARVFDPVAEPGEWAISGAFAFSNWTEADLTGKARQAFANGWLGLTSFGRATFVAAAPITEAEYHGLTEILSAHFVAGYGAPDLDAARPVAQDELAQMAEMCADHAANTLFTVERLLEESGIRERIRTIVPRDAGLEAFAVHKS